VRRRHERGTSHGRDIERLRVVAIDEVARPAQVHEVGDLLGRHAGDGNRPVVAAALGPSVFTGKIRASNIC